MIGKDLPNPGKTRRIGTNSNERRGFGLEDHRCDSFRENRPSSRVMREKAAKNARARIWRADMGNPATWKPRTHGLFPHSLP